MRWLSDHGECELDQTLYLQSLAHLLRAVRFDSRRDVCILKEYNKRFCRIVVKEKVRIARENDRAGKVLRM